MKKILLALPVALLLFSFGGPGRKAPAGLMTEYIRDTRSVRIMDLCPEFSWIVPSEAKTQAAFRILVASSPAKLNAGRADVWDSGKTSGSNSSSVAYGGVSLKPSTRYYWKVMIWDYRNKPSAFSETMSFTTGRPTEEISTHNSFLQNREKPASVRRIAPGLVIYDFGKDAFGTLVISSTGFSGDSITVRLGEKLSASGRIDRKPGGSIRFTETRLLPGKGEKEFLISLPPDSRNTGPAAIHLPDSVGVVTPFRYAEIEGSDVSAITAERKCLTSYFEDGSSSFTSSDTILNQVWDLCSYSMKATSFAGYYVDGDRERIPYEADAYINQLGHFYVDREYAMSRSTIEYFIHHPTWPTEWILQTVPMFWNDFMFTGDSELLDKYYNELKAKTLSALDRGDGLITVRNVTDDVMKSIGFANPKERIRDIVDWPPAQKDTGWKLATAEGERDGYDMRDVNTMVNAFYYNNLVLMSKIAGVLGKKADSADYILRASRTFIAFNTKLYNKTKDIYLDGEGSTHSSLHANMTALAFGLVPPDRRDAVIAFIKSRGMACSVYGAQYLLEGLYNAGQGDYAMSLLTSTGDRSWYNMIRSGSTIAMEAWDMKYKPNSDWNHAWGAAPASIIPGWLWGIRPVLPGFARAEIRPQLAGLSSCSVKVPTIKGPIEAKYHVSGNSSEYIITIPGNMECDLVVPGKKPVRLNSGTNTITLNK